MRGTAGLPRRSSRGAKAGLPRRSSRGAKAGRIETWLTCPIVLFMALALIIALVFPSWPWWVRAIPLSLAGLLILIAFYYSLLPPNKPPPPPDHSPR